LRDDNLHIERTGEEFGAHARSFVVDCTAGADYGLLAARWGGWGSGVGLFIAV